MCGIAGKVYFKKGKEVHLQELKDMSAKIIHRGPDDEGYYLSKNKSVGLVSRRLAIIDLSKKGHMPMTYQDRYVITYNGEVYNFKEEKIALEKIGYKFNSNSDTEVILALYSKYKEKCLEHLRGMFAFAIYDIKEQTLFLARDRMGKKPLKYYLSEDVFIFASELKAILTQPEVKAVPDQSAIQQYFLYGYVPSPNTGFVGIKKLEAGHYLKIDIKRRIIIDRKYWELDFTNKLDLSENEWSEKILETLEESTKLRMISDVPIGAFLSGGVDSSAVVAMMALNSKNKIKTFTIKYANKRWSEDKYARIIAKKYHTDHTEILATPSNIRDLPEIASQYEEPFSDNSALVSFMVCREARKHVTVVLNGDGGDENFAGYGNRYLRLKRDVDYNLLINIINKFPFKTGVRKIDNYIKKSNDPIYQKFASYNRIFDDGDYDLEKNVFENFKGLDMKDAGLKFDLKYFLTDLLLAKMDIASMRYSLETRSPLLDHNMIELGCQIPFDLKVKNGETKYIFKKALEKIVPKENLYRPKMGFTISLEDWFKGDLDGYFKKTVMNNKAKLNEFINIEDMNLDTNTKKWNVLMFELWLQNYF